MPLWEDVGADKGFGKLALQMDHSSRPLPFPCQAWEGVGVVER